jgi:hypothetical protein
MEIVNTDYYMPKEIQSGLDLQKIPGTSYIDPVDALFSNESMDPSDGQFDPYNVSILNIYNPRS